MSTSADPDTPGMTYREYPVPAPLSDYFLCFWAQTVCSPQGDYEHPVFPDACVDVVAINDDAAVVVGPWTEPFIARLAAGTRIVGARLHPGRAPSLLRMSAAELLNRSVPLSEVLGNARAANFDRVSEAVSTVDRRAALTEVLIADRGKFAAFDRAVSFSIRWLAHNPHGSVEQLSEQLGISGRQLHRRFLSAVGYGPKLLHSILRFQRTLRMAGEPRSNEPLVDLALRAGFADQAHMTREVRRFSNRPPTALLRETQSTLQMSDLFKT